MRISSPPLIFTTFFVTYQSGMRFFCQKKLAIDRHLVSNIVQVFPTYKGFGDLFASNSLLYSYFFKKKNQQEIFLQKKPVTKNCGLNDATSFPSLQKEISKKLFSRKKFDCACQFCLTTIMAARKKIMTLIFFPNIHTIEKFEVKCNVTL